MSFPSDIKTCMRDCILKIFWPKDYIVQFFKDNGCTDADIRVLGDYKELHRYQIVDQMFDHLSFKPDGGLGPFRAMLLALTNWSFFDPYYFDRLRKLNRAEADRCITHLKQLQEIRDHKIKEKRKQRAVKEAAAQDPKQSITELKEKYISLIQGVNRPGYSGDRLV